METEQEKGTKDSLTASDREDSEDHIADRYNTDSTGNRKEESIRSLSTDEGRQSDDGLERYQEFIMQLRGINLCFQKQCQAPMGEITFLMTIQHMCRREGMISASGLGRQMNLSRPAVSRMIHTLKKKGYIDFHPGEDDHRYLYIALTDQGRKLIGREMDRCMTLINSAREKMGKEEMDRYLYYSGRFSDLLAGDRSQMQ